MITKEWLEDQVVALGEQLFGAKERFARANLGLEKAREEYGNAREAVESLEGCLYGLKQELADIEGREDRG